MAGFSRFKKTQVKDALAASEKEPEETCSGKETASNFRWLLLENGVLHNFRYALMILCLTGFSFSQQRAKMTRSKNGLKYNFAAKFVNLVLFTNRNIG